jgi:hypothetical protein
MDKQSPEQCLSSVLRLDDGSLLARFGMPGEKGQVLRIDRHGMVPVIGLTHFGRCPQRRYFALANADGVRITDGWDGPQMTRLAWPTGLENLPRGYPFEPFDLPPTPTALVPLPDGQRVLLVSAEGIFLLASGGATRLLPRQVQIAEALATGIDPDDIDLRLSMAQGAVSPDGRLIMVGEQNSPHLVLNEQLEVIGEIATGSEQPLMVDGCQLHDSCMLGKAYACLRAYAEDDEVRQALFWKDWQSALAC